MNDSKAALEGLRNEREQDLEPGRARWRRWSGLLLLVGLAGAVAWGFFLRPISVRTVVARPAEVVGPRTVLNASG